MDASPTPSALAPTHDRLQQLIDSIEIDGIYMLDATGHVITWNRGAEHNKGYTRQEILGQHYSLFFTPEDLASNVPQSILNEAATAGRKAGEAWRVRKNGERFWASFVISALYDDKKHLTGYSKVIRDLTDRKLQEEAMLRLQAELQEERDRLRAAAESSLDALFLVESVRDPQGHIEDFTFTFLNSNVQRYLPIPRADLIGHRMLPILAACPALAFFDHYKTIVETGQPFIHEYTPADDNLTSLLPALSSLSPQEQDSEGDTWLRMQAVRLNDGIAITIADITERKRSQLQVEYLAQHDPLTGLLNRNLLDDRLRQGIKRANLTQRQIAFLILDLDRFKEINDKYGHAAGDHVLRTVAQRFNSIIRATDTLVRSGGDEFIMILPDLRHLDDLAPIVHNLIDALALRIHLGDEAGTVIQQTCSIGIAVYPQSATDPTNLLRHADLAMYAAKEKGQNLHRIYLPYRENPDQPSRDNLEKSVFFSLDELPNLTKSSPK